MDQLVSSTSAFQRLTAHSSLGSFSYSTGSLPSITLTHNLFPIILRELLVPSSADAVKYRVEYWQEGEGQSRFGLVSASSPGRLDSFMEEQVRHPSSDGWDMRDPAIK